MIKKIKINKVASYKQESTLATEKKINIIYGLNGVGKTIFSNYLYDIKNTSFSNCSVEGLSDDEELLVYNQQFIHDYFYQPDNLKGIFTLSKDNKEAVEKIKNATNEIQNFEKQKLTLLEKEKNLANNLNTKTKQAEDSVWKIKSDYFVGDRVLEYCLSGYLGSKRTLLDKISKIQKPKQQPIETIDQLKKNVERVNGSTAQKYNPLTIINFQKQDIETNPIFQKQIVGNGNSFISQLITQLGNSDWVKKGLTYLKKTRINAHFASRI